MDHLPVAPDARHTGGWLTDHVLRLKGPDYSDRVLARVLLGSRAGGAVRGARIIAANNACAACRAAAGIVYDPEFAPRLPLAGCMAGSGCHCAYATVMLYEPEDAWGVDHRVKSGDYGARVLERLRIGTRAHGAIGGVRVVASGDSCEACRAAVGPVSSPGSAPLIPVATCTRAEGCRCAYVAVAAYQLPGASA